MQNMRTAIYCTVLFIVWNISHRICIQVLRNEQNPLNIKSGTVSLILIEYYDIIALLTNVCLEREHKRMLMTYKQYYTRS